MLRVLAAAPFLRPARAGLPPEGARARHFQREYGVRAGHLGPDYVAISDDPPARVMRILCQAGGLANWYRDRRAGAAIRPRGIAFLTPDGGSASFAKVTTLAWPGQPGRKEMTGGADYACVAN